MSLFHQTAEDDAFARGHLEAGLYMRARWVKKLRAALLPFVEGRATTEDVEEAKRVLENTKEWL